MIRNAQYELGGVRELYTNSTPMNPKNSSIIKSALENLGLSENEIALYCASISLGAKPASTLARTLRIQRTRVYDLLSSLESRGLMESVERNRGRYYVPCRPDRLIALLKSHEQTVIQQNRQFETILPSIFGSIGDSESSIEVRRVRGLREVRQTLESLLEEPNTTIVCIGDLEQALQSSPLMGRWAKKFRDLRLSKEISLRMALQGPPDIIEESQLRRLSLYSPDIPNDILLLTVRDVVVVVDLTGATNALIVESKLLNSVIRGLHSAWSEAVSRTS